MADLVTQAWLDSPTAHRVLLAQIGTVTPKYLATTGLTVSGQIYEPAIFEDIVITSSIGLDYTSNISFSDISINNFNGVRDSWLSEVWVNKTITIYFGDASWTTLANFKQVFTGVVGNIDASSRNLLNITIRDSLQKLNYAVTETLLGNYNPTAVPGYTNPNEKQLRPICLGEVFNITPLQTSPILLEYMCHDGEVESILEVRDNGVPVPFETGISSVSYASSTSSITVGTGSKTFATTNTTSVLVGMLVRVHYTSDTSVYMEGTIQSIVTNTSITISVTSTGGAAGTYALWSIKIPIPPGSFRLVSKPFGAITASVQGAKVSTNLTTNVGVNTYSSNIVNIIGTLIRSYSKGGSINTTSFPAAETIATTNTAMAGIYITDRLNVFSLCETLAANNNMVLYTELDGTIGIKELVIPTSGAVAAISDSTTLADSLEISGTPDIVVGYRLGYAKNWTTQVGLVTDIPEEHKLEFAKEWLESTYVNTTAKTTYGLSGELPLEETYLITQAAATTIATAKVALRSTRRAIYRMTLVSSHLTVTVGSPVTITSTRFGFTSTPTYGLVVTASPNWLRGTIEIEVLI